MVGRRRGLALLAGAVCAVSAGSVLAYAAAEDEPDTFNVVSGTLVKATNSASLTIVANTSAGSARVTCEVSTFSGKTGKTLGFGITPAKLSDRSGSPCSDSLGLTDTFTSSGAWAIKEADRSDDEGFAEPNTTGDQLVITVPKSGLVDHNSSSANCTITVAPTAAIAITGTYNDKGLYAIQGVKIPVKTSGCPVSGSSATLTVTYKLSPAVYDEG